MQTPQPSPPGTPPGTPNRFNTYAPPPSVVKKHERRGINKMDNAIEIIVGMSEDDTRIGEFGQKLKSQQTKYFNRANQSSTTRVYIDDHDVNPRFVYKLGTYSKMKREIENYEKLENIDPRKTHILTRMSDLIEIPGTDVAMFITLYQDGLTSDNLLYNPDNTELPEGYEDLAVKAEEYLKSAGLEHDDIAGNLYVIDDNDGNKTFFWIDFEEMKGQSSWNFSFNPFSPTKRRRDPDSPPHNTSTEASTSSSSDVSPVSEVSASSIETNHMPYPYRGGSRKKRSRKSKKHKKKSHKKKSRKNISKKSKK